MRNDLKDPKGQSSDVFGPSGKTPRTPPQSTAEPILPLMPSESTKDDGDSDGDGAPAESSTQTAASTNMPTTAHSCQQSDETNNEQSSENLIKALKKVQNMLSKPSIKKDEKDEASGIIGSAISHIIACNNRLEENHNQQVNRSNPEDGARFRNIEEQLAKLTKTIMNPPPQTYAQVVQRNTTNPTISTGNQTNHPESGLRKRMEKVRQERIKIEVILTTRDVNDNMKDQLTNMSEEALMKHFEQAMKDVGLEYIKIRRIQKTSQSWIQNTMHDG